MIAYARLRFVGMWEKVDSRIHSPLYWRHDLEMALRKTACILPRQECATCILKNRCFYVGTFLPGLASDENTRGKESLPFPFSLLFPQTRDSQMEFTLEVSLVGRWVDRLPYWIYALGRVGKSKSHPFRILHGDEWTQAGWNRFYDGETEAVERTVSARAPLVPELGAEVILRWIRPGRLLRRGKPMVPLGFGELVDALWRRIRALERCYGEGTPRYDGHSELLQRAQDVEAIPKGLRWVEGHRLSRTQDQSVALSGFLGAMILKGDLAPFGELLALGRDLGVGKGTALGLGRYELVT
ncbi:MAG: CRISPR system precrRNA processing endoribonuclease RAMP protein Cas6 [Thermodesulfobacteriota bacterium]